MEAFGINEKHVVFKNKYIKHLFKNKYKKHFAPALPDILGLSL